MRKFNAIRNAVNFGKGKKMNNLFESVPVNNDVETIKDIEVGDMVEFTYNGSGRVGEVTYKCGFRPAATHIPSDNWSYNQGYITVDTKHDGFRTFRFNKMSDVVIVAVSGLFSKGEEK